MDWVIRGRFGVRSLFFPHVLAIPARTLCCAKFLGWILMAEVGVFNPLLKYLLLNDALRKPKSILGIDMVKGPKRSGEKKAQKLKGGPHLVRSARVKGVLAWSRRV